MVAHNDKRLLWHPRHHDRFVVGGGSQITLYEWIPKSSEIKQVTAQQDLPHMRVTTLPYMKICQLLSKIATSVLHGLRARPSTTLSLSDIAPVK